MPRNSHQYSTDLLRIFRNSQDFETFEILPNKNCCYALYQSERLVCTDIIAGRPNFTEISITQKYNNAFTK